MDLVRKYNPELVSGFQYDGPSRYHVPGTKYHVKKPSLFQKIGFQRGTWNLIIRL